MPRLACTRLMSRMISACVVTSSAVEGSSAMSSSGSRDERRGEGDPLAHAAGELERHSLRDVLVGDADLGEAALHLERTRGAAGKFRTVGEHFLDVGAGAHQRVHHRERVLQDERDAVAAQPPHFLLRQCENVAAVEDDAALGADAGRQQARDRPRGQRFARARFADDRQRLAAAEVEIGSRRDGKACRRPRRPRSTGRGR